MLYAPEIPTDLPADQIADGVGHLRYEDVSQDGRVTLLGLPPALGLVTWRKLLGDHPITVAGRQQGIVPILTRMVLIGAEGTVPVGRPLDARGAYQLGHTRGDDGAVNRLILNLWASMRGVKGRTYAPPPAGHGDKVDVGTIYAEHVFTRPFAPKGQRKVLAFDADGLAPVPSPELPWRPPEAALALPDGAAALDAEIRPATPISFGLYHTDSNQHVNSLVYPRLFEQAVLDRLAELGRSTAVLSRYAEVTYRKPCFAGERLWISLQAYELGDRVGAIGCFADAELTGDPATVAAARPRCFVHMQLAR
jgi:hypothetical protein